MSTFDDFPGLPEAGHRAEKAARVLESALEHLRPRSGEGWAEVALRLRGAAVLAHTAGLELAVVSGWNEAASAAGEGGMLEIKESE